MSGSGVPRDDRAERRVRGGAVADRVLVVVEGTTRSRRALIGPLGAQLARGRPALRLEVRSDAAGLLRIVRSHPRSLSGYAAVVVLAPSGSQRRRVVRAPLAVAERSGAVVPTLVVRTRRAAGRGRRSGTAGSPPDAEYDVLELEAGLPPAAAAGTIAVTVRAMLLRRGPRVTQGDRRPDPLVAMLPAQGVDAAALHRLGRIVRMTRDAFALEVAEVNLLDEREVTTIAAAGGGTGPTARADSLCDIAAGSAGLTVIPDTRRDPRARMRRSARGTGAIRFYAAHTIASARGEVIGMLCVHDPVPQEPDELDLDLLRDLAMLVEGELMAACRRTGTA